MKSAKFSHTLHRLKGYSAFHQNPIFLNDLNMKNINTLLINREKFYQLHTETTTAGKTDPSEIGRTYDIKNELNSIMILFNASTL